MRFAASDVAAYFDIVDVLVAVALKCIKCYRWRCKVVC